MNHRKISLTIFSCPQPQGKLKKDKGVHRFAIKSLSSDSRMAVSIPMVYDNSIFQVDFRCTMKLLVPLWLVNLHRTLTEDDPPLAFPSLCPQWTSLKEGLGIIAANSHWYKSVHKSSENDWFPHIAMVLKTQKVWNEKLNVLLTVQFRIMSIYHTLFFQTLHLKNKIKSKWRVSIVGDIY